MRLNFFQRQPAAAWLRPLEVTAAPLRAQNTPGHSSQHGTGTRLARGSLLAQAGGSHQGTRPNFQGPEGSQRGTRTGRLPLRPRQPRVALGPALASVTLPPLRLNHVAGKPVLGAGLARGQTRHLLSTGPAAGAHLS